MFILSIVRATIHINKFYQP